jgi:hypothetical protein
MSLIQCIVSGFERTSKLSRDGIWVYVVGIYIIGVVLIAVILHLSGAVLRSL